jgi:hypothetical protein
MIPKNHIVLGFLFSTILFFLSPKIGLIEASIIFLSSFLIDIDHYLYFVFKNKKINPIKAIKYFFNKREKFLSLSKKEKSKVYSGFYFLHGIETLFVLCLLGKFVSGYFYFVFLGVFFHLILDYIDQITNCKRIDKLSSIYDYFKFKKLEQI